MAQTFYVDMQTGAQLSQDQLVPGKSYITSGTGAVYVAPQKTSSPQPTPTPTPSGQNLTVPAGSNTPGYTYVNGALTSVGGQPAINTTSTPTSTSTNTSTTPAALSALQATTGAALDHLSSVASQGNTFPGGFAAAQQAAANNPDLIAKYADAAKLDAQTFSQNLQQLQQANTSEAQTNQQQFENDRKQLADQEAAKGAAYSGFRNQAQNQLGQTESGIVQSSRATLQNNLNSATKAFEAKYGTSATTPATANFLDPAASSNVSLSGQFIPQSQQPTALTGALTGGITGSTAPAKTADINQLATSYLNAGQVIPTASLQ